jgi:hypothetical protein
MKRRSWSLISFLLLPLLIPAGALYFPFKFVGYLARVAKWIARPWRVARLHAAGWSEVGPVWVKGKKGNRRRLSS